MIDKIHKNQPVMQYFHSIITWKIGRKGIVVFLINKIFVEIFLKYIIFIIF